MSLFICICYNADNIVSLVRQTVFASIMAPSNRIRYLPRIIFWIWLHLLQFCVSNQCVNPEEDAVNKPWRPIPAGRITVSQAQNLRWVLMASSLLLSLYRGILPASVLLCLSTIAYNDLGFHGHIMLRSICNAVGYASFELGATQLSGMASLSTIFCTHQREIEQATLLLIRLALWR